MRDTGQMVTIQPGWDVYGSDDQHLGTVAEVGDNYLLVQKGLIFVHDMYVPVSAVEVVGDEAIRLNVSKSEAESMSWDEPPEEGSWNEWWASRSGDRSTTDRERIAVHEEELEATKTARQAGEVQVTKDVVEEQRSMDVPVTREEVRVRRVPADREATPGEMAFQEGDTIRVPVTEEEVEVTKRPRVKEEIEIEKVARQDTERATGTVRQERVDVSAEGDATVRDDRSTVRDDPSAVRTDRTSTSTSGRQRSDPRTDTSDESGTEALGAGAGALGGAAVGGAVGGPPGAAVGGVVGAAAGGLAGEATEGDEEAGSAAGGAGGTAAGAALGGAVAGPPGAVVGGAVGGAAGAGIGDEAEEEAKDEDDDQKG
jgi:uncharacterized protein (TIGR02271 family)